MVIAPSLPLHPLQICNAPDWTRTSMPIKAQALNLLCIPNSTTGAIQRPNYNHQERELSSEISVSAEWHKVGPEYHQFTNDVTPAKTFG